MGCGTSATVQPSPLEQAIVQEDLDQLKTLLQSVHMTSLVQTPTTSRDVDYSQCHITTQWNSPLVVAARMSSMKVVYFLLKTCPNIESEIKREALMCVLHQGKGADPAIIRLLLRHGADIRSPLRLCQALKILNFYSVCDIKRVFDCLLTNCDISNRSVIHGALLSCVCSQSVRIRARLGTDAGIEYLEWLFLQGVQPRTYWDTYFLDTCICDDGARLFRPTSVTLLFARTLTTPSLFKPLMVSAQMFKMAHTDVLEILWTLYNAGCFTQIGTKLNAAEKRTLLLLNPDVDALEDVLDALETVHKNPSPLLLLASRKIRNLFGEEHNPLSGTVELQQQMYIPESIKHILTIE